MPSLPPTNKEAKRRQHVGQYIYSLWTRNGSEESGIAPTIFDGRIDALGVYMTFADYNINNDDEDDCEMNIDKDNNESIQTSENDHLSVSCVHCRDLSYKEFANNYMYPNIPVIIDGLTDDWESRKHWVTLNSEGVEVPNLEYLKSNFGSDQAPVYQQSGPGFALSRPISHCQTLAEYVDWWQSQCLEEKDSTIRYFKDWKFMVSHPDCNAYKWPIYFKNDWLNGAMGHAYKFAYLGPAGSSTVLHADVLRSFSWSANICGEKRWYLVPPEYTYLLYDCFGKTLTSHLHVDVEHPGLSFLFPGLSLVRKVARKVIQTTGQTIFVPSNWFHTVENIKDTLSINHNWLNESNFTKCWQHVCNEFAVTQSMQASAQLAESCDELKQSNDNSQAIDDFLLLWNVIKTKLQLLRNMKRETHQKHDMSLLQKALKAMEKLSKCKVTTDFALATEVHEIMFLAAEMNNDAL